MDSLIQEILVAAKVTKADASNVNDAMTRLEQWLDMDGNVEVTISTYSPTETTSSTVEDSAPFSWKFYQSVGRAVVEAWNPSIADGGPGATAVSPEKGILSQSSPQDVSLFQIPSVRVTRWLRHWMDLNVMGTSTSNTSDGVTSFSQLLLKHCEGNTTNRSAIASSSSTKETEEQRRVPRVHVLKALFHHIASLPQLQHQVHLYTQSLLRNSSNNSSGPTTATTRLEQLQASNKISEKLTWELDLHLQHLEDILGEWYSVCNATLRASCKAHFGRVWQGYIHVTSHRSGGVGMGRMENTSACGIDLTLRVLNRILMGGTTSLGSGSLHPSLEHLLFEVLISLHKPSGMVLWRDQTPLLDLYHKPLVQCIGTILQRNLPYVSRVVSYLLQPEIWPSSQGVGSASANTPKVVLLLHEIDTFFGLLSRRREEDLPMEEAIDALRDTIGPLTVRLGGCISSDNSRVSERALQFFKNETFVSIIKEHLPKTLPTLLRALCRTSDQMQLPWNPTVRKMTRLVLQELESYDQQAFARACQDLFKGGPSVRVPEPAKADSAKKRTSQGTAIMKSMPKKEAAQTQDFSLRAGMGSWKPPSPSSRSHRSNQMLPPPARPPANRSSGTQPPLTVTGVAPWAVSSQPGSGGSTSAPPLTVTGVAPWANRPQDAGSMRPPRKRIEAAKGSPYTPETHISPQFGISNVDPLSTGIEEEDEGSDENVEQNNADNAGLAKVRWYMEQLKPSSSEQDDEGTSSWALVQMAESPTLLPTLKFHDLVFGQDLGSGAFGSVRYARQIVKSKTRSHWPEYAVKIVSTQRIEEMGYEQSINREIAILRLMSHPGIARLISSFRFRDGAYLVLEYASGGDLHTLLKNNGSLDVESTKFVVGSVVAALWSIHDMGFVFGDLKPENVLITETKHIKLTDFGGCRPVTNRAKGLIRFSSKNLLGELRDGDWKPKADSLGRGAKRSIWSDADDSSKHVDSMDVDDEEEGDHRIEGTTAYLPPEVVIGGIPTPKADSWALGCVLYQCISGRPPLLEDDDAMTRNKIVAFHLSGSDQEDSREALFVVDGESTTTFTPETRTLVLALLHRDPASRPNMLQVAADPFFRGTDVFSLHKNPGHHLDVGNVAPVADAKWSRRQFSSIWAPQPEAYAINAPDKASLSSKTGPIPEGEEAAAFFSKSHDHTLFGNIPENIPVA